jgi:hypothetical protein
MALLASFASHAAFHRMLAGLERGKKRAAKKGY